MKRAIHVSYQFNTENNISGFGDCCLNNLDREMTSSEDVISLKKRLREELLKEGHKNPTVIIIAWNMLTA